MGVGISLIVTVVGMMLIYAAPSAVLAGVDTLLAGLIFVLVGAIGAILHLLLWLSAPPPERDRDHRRRGSLTRG